MKLIGKIIEIGELQSGVSQTNGKEWKQRDFVVSYQNGNFESFAKLSLFGDMANTKIRVGVFVECNFSVQAKKSKGGEWFNSLSCYQVNPTWDEQQTQVLTQQAQPQPVQQKQVEQQPQPTAQQVSQQEMPF